MVVIDDILNVLYAHEKFLDHKKYKLKFKNFSEINPIYLNAFKIKINL